MSIRNSDKTLATGGSILSFDSCAVYDRRELFTTLTSKSTVSFKSDMSKVAQFKFDRSKDELPRVEIARQTKQ